MMFDRALAPLGITRSQWWVLAFISRKDGLPQTQLANELDVGKVAVGALIDRLESSGFVIRQADPVDRRVKRVYVTKQARGFLEKLRKETDKFNAMIVNGIDRKQLEGASDALLAMKHNLLAMSDGTLTEGQKESEETEAPRAKHASDDGQPELAPIGHAAIDGRWIISSRFSRSQRSPPNAWYPPPETPPVPQASRETALRRPFPDTPSSPRA
jgi:DNA-binding MarR family transcriptional regulator